MENEGRDLVLPNNSYAFVLDETKGHISCYVGPSKTQLADTDKLVIFDYDSKKYNEASRTQAVKQISVAPEGWYTILKNPAKDQQQPQPSTSESISLDKLHVGRKVHIPGPVAFALWPGQMSQVVQGHLLRSNQYLIVRVYDADAAKENWKHTIIQKTTTTENPEKPLLPLVGSSESVNDDDETSDDASDESKTRDNTSEDPQTTELIVDSILDDDIEFTVGKLMIVNGTDVSFFIPPTGIEVVKDDHGSYTRDAVTLERLTYCILLDENGSKRYVRGPAVVFPKPTEIFQTQSKNGMRTRKFRAIELNDISGIYLKVIAPYTEGGRDYREGEELFITGKEQAIYYRRDEHQIIRYGDTEIHYATAIPKGEARYVLQRLTGRIKTVNGPEMLLPDPRTEVIVRRVLPLEKIALMYPGNTDALQYNEHLNKITDGPTDFVTDNQYAASDCDDETSYGQMVGRSARGDVSMGDVMTTASKGRMSDAYSRLSGDTGILEKSSTYTKPRTVTLDTKYDGAVRIQVWTGYAVIIVDGIGKRKVIEGPATYNLEYDEYPEKIQMSTGKPKNTDRLQEDIYLRTKNNKVADIVKVETKDLVQVSMKLSYKINFIGDSKKWFDVENYVKFFCDHMRSRLKGYAQTASLDTFYNNSVEQIRNVVLGKTAEGKERGTLFEENNMFVADVEVLKVTIDDHEIANDIINTQQEIVTTTISTARKEELLVLKKRLYALEEEDRELALLQAKDKSTKYLTELKLAQDDLLGEHDLKTEKNELKSKREMDTQNREDALSKKSQEARQDRRSESDVHEAGRQDDLDVISQSEQERTKADHVIQNDRNKAANELEKDLIGAQAQAVVDQVKAIQPGLIEALQSSSEVGLLTKVMPHAIPLSVVEGKSVGHTLTSLFDGTSIGQVLHNMVNKEEE